MFLGVRTLVAAISQPSELRRMAYQHLFVLLQSLKQPLCCCTQKSRRVSPSERLKIPVSAVTRSTLIPPNTQEPRLCRAMARTVIESNSALYGNARVLTMDCSDGI